MAQLAPQRLPPYNFDHEWHFRVLQNCLPVPPDRLNDYPDELKRLQVENEDSGKTLIQGIEWSLLLLVDLKAVDSAPKRCYTKQGRIFFNRECSQRELQQLCPGVLWTSHTDQLGLSSPVFSQKSIAKTQVK